MVLVGMKQIHVFNFPQELDLIKTIETGTNIHGLCELSNDPNMELLIYPGNQIGSVQVYQIFFLDCNFLDVLNVEGLNSIVLTPKVRESLINKDNIF